MSKLITDEQVAMAMKAKLQGQSVSFVGYTRESGENFLVTVVGGGTVKIPRDTTKAWFGWSVDSPAFMWMPMGQEWQHHPNVNFITSNNESVHIGYE